MRLLTRSCFLLLFFREVLFAWPPSPSWKTYLFSLWNPPFPPHAPALIPLFLAKVQLFITLTLSLLTIWQSGQIALFFLAKAALVYLSTAHFVALRPFFSAGPSLLQVCHFSSFLLLSDSLCSRHPILFSVFPFTLNPSGRSIRNCVLFFLCYLATVGSRTFISVAKRRV